MKMKGLLKLSMDDTTRPNTTDQ